MNGANQWPTMFFEITSPHTCNILSVNALDENDFILFDKVQ